MIDPYMEDWKILIMNRVQDSSGEAWTAKMCRLINSIEESKRGISWCGRCADYANMRKRKKAARQPMLLPGFDDGAYLIHAPCTTIRLKRLMYILRWLEDHQLVYSTRETIPDPCTPRGWDTATVWHFIE